MKKIYEHNDKAIKSFIIGDHQIDVLESSKKGLLLEINDHTLNATTTAFIHTRDIKKIMKMIYENYFGISDNSIGSVKFTLYVSHIENLEYYSGKGYFEVWVYPDKEVIIKISTNNKWCQYIRFKSFNDILVVENL